MRSMRTWLGPSFRGEGLVGNAITRRYTDEDGLPQTDEQSPEPPLPCDVVELRVHGVNGGSPEQNLHDPSPVRVAGDDTAGFYRRRKELNSGPDRTVEAYNWSSINSKKRVRAWWLVLFPFAAANFAGWLLPKELDDQSGRRRPAQILVRLIGLCVTILAVLGSALVFVDLIGVQCGTLETCKADFTWGWVGSIADWGILDNRPTRLATAYSLLPALALLVLWLLGRRSRAYEAYGAGKPNSDGAIGDVIDTVRMDRVEFWQAPDVVYVQAWLHGTAGVAALGACMAFAIRELAPGAQHHDTLLALGILSMIIVATAAAAEVGVSWMHQIPTAWLRKKKMKFFMPRWSWLPAGSAIGLFVATLWLGWISVGGADTDQAPLEAIRNGLIVAAGAAVILVFALAFLIRAHRSAWFALLTGPLLIIFMAQAGEDPRITWFGGGVWLLIEILMAVGGILFYRRRATNSEHPPDPDKHRFNPTWIYGTTALIIVTGAAAFIRVDNLFLKVMAVFIPIVYLWRQFVTQVQFAHDYPAKEQMREGTTAVMAALGVCAILTAISSGGVFVANRLGETRPVPRLSAEAPSDFCLSTLICYPAEIGWYSLAALAGFLALGVTIGLRLLVLNRQRWSDKDEDLCRDFDVQEVPPLAYDDAGECLVDHHPERLSFANRGRNARWFANITDDADWVISASVMTTLTLLVSAAVARGARMLPTKGGNWVFDAASAAVAFVVVGAGFLIYAARDNKQLRATLGILWDVMSFFPRRFHPLAPPCYAERAVIDVRNRVIYATTRGRIMEDQPVSDGRLILTAHSEGTLISTAALLSLLPGNASSGAALQPLPGHPIPTGKELEDMAFVTYGCMLARLFGRAWPDQLPEAKLVELKQALEGGEARPAGADVFPYPPEDRLSRWINFGRYSDYLGGRVFQELQRKPTLQESQPEGDHRCDDVFFIDPIRRWRWHGQLHHARVWRHSFDYESDQEDPRFREHIWAMARVFRGEDESMVRGDYPWMANRD